MNGIHGGGNNAGSMGKIIFVNHHEEQVDYRKKKMKKRSLADLLIKNKKDTINESYMS